mgnify:FL=1
MPEGLKYAKCLRVGVTGGIGSGKSTVCLMFAALGAPVYNADIWAKWLTSNDQKLKQGIVEIFGEQAYTAAGEYNRPYVAGIAFSDAARLAALNALVHPAVEQHSLEWHRQQALQNIPYTIREAALMIESGSHRSLDRLIVVTAPEQLRLERVVERDHVTEAQVRARMQHQLPESEKIKRADFVIDNDGARMLVPQVWQIHRKLLQEAQNT